MLFNSIEFLFCFLPLVLVVFLLLQRSGSVRLVALWLTLASLFFYAWWNPVYLLLLLLSAAVNYTLGLLLARAHRVALAGDDASQRGQARSGPARHGPARRGPARRGRLWLVLGVVFNLGLLIYFKYANFFLDSMNEALELGWNVRQVILPLAISFYTFQQITYLVDTSKGRTEPHGFLDYCLFVSFFPQLIAGPIVHHSEMLAQFRNLGVAGDRVRNLTLGFSILVIGLFKKVVVADSFALLATPVFSLASGPVDLHSLDALVGIFAYAFQLYFDFSGYSDMAIGLACLFGLRLPVNFFSPYRAQNISDFWRMWHATLSRFLRDYVYMPLGGFLCSPRRQRFNLFMTMFLGGVWHGAGWTFVLYGFCHGAYVVLHQLWRIRVSGPRGWVNRPVYMHLAQLLTFLVVVFTLVLFRADSVTVAGDLYASVFDPGGWTLAPELAAQLARSNLLKLAAAIVPFLSPILYIAGLLFMGLLACWLLPSTWQLFQAWDVAIPGPAAGRAPVLALQWHPTAGWSIFMAVLALACCLNLSQVSEFLYFQF